MARFHIGLKRRAPKDFLTLGGVTFHRHTIKDSYRNPGQILELTEEQLARIDDAGKRKRVMSVGKIDRFVVKDASEPLADGERYMSEFIYINEVSEEAEQILDPERAAPEEAIPGREKIDPPKAKPEEPRDEKDARTQEKHRKARAKGRRV